MTTEVYQADSLEWMRLQPRDRFDLVFGSPPYVDCRTYGIGAQRNCEQWVEWMLEITEAAANCCKGPVIWVAAGATRKRNYWPAVEGLMWEWWKRGGTHQLYRPCVFYRVGIPGSGVKDWFRADWEYIACFKRPGALPWSDNTACGHPPKWAPGGEMSHRLSDGTRVNQWGHSIERKANGERIAPARKVQTRRRKDGVRPGSRGRDGMHNQEQDYQEPVLANPGNVFRVPVGGGLMGSDLAHENEAPFPEKLAEIFVRSCCPDGGWVLDPFCGSGTTLAVADKWGRNAVGVDVRESQVELTRRRIAEGHVLFARTEEKNPTRDMAETTTPSPRSLFKE